MPDNVSLRNDDVEVDEDDLEAVDAKEAAANETALQKLADPAIRNAFIVHCRLHRRLAAALDAPRWQESFGVFVIHSARRAVI